MSNDPVVIVDGIRVNSAQVDGSENLAGDVARGTNQLVSSPLDAIDPNSIETVEVFKGPSAVALYGTDAVNGVIVVTTKRGQVGPARWTSSAVWGQTIMPGKWPTNYVRLGTLPSGGVVDCPSVREASSIYPAGSGNGCIPLENGLLTYQILNDPTTTVFGTGRTRNLTTTVSGGTKGFAYSFSGTLKEEIGLLKMADVDVSALHEADQSVPEWQRRPQGSESQNGTVKVTADLGRANVEFTTTLAKISSRTTPLQQVIAIAGGLRPPGISEFGSIVAAPVGSGALAKVPNFRARTSSRTITNRNSLRVLASPHRWLKTEAVAGVEVSDGTDLVIFSNGDCTELFGGNCMATTSDNDGRFNNGAKSNIVTSLTLRAYIPAISFGRWVSLRPSVNGDYALHTSHSFVRQASGLPAGATSGNGATAQSTTEFSDDRSTAGLYVETMFGFADHLFLPLSLRMDAGSGLGATVRPTYPRINPSFLISDLPAFRRIPLIGRLETVRLRTAYGQSGVQPSVSAKLRTYTQLVGVIDGVSVMSTEINSFGNSLLRPEKTSEFEGGADIEMLDGRFGLKLTGYRKRTVDALVSIDVPNSVNGGGKQLRNVGNVDNTGMEFEINATILQQRFAFWQVNIGLSKNRNKLVKLGRDSLLVGATSDVRTRFIEGYPLYGQWALPVVGFEDLNGDGWITTRVTGGIDEVQLGTDPVYLGAPYPNFESSLHSTLTLLKNISIGIAFNYQHGLTQKNDGAGATRLLNRQAFNDPTTPLATQAYMAIAQPCVGMIKGGCNNTIGLVQTTSTLRFNGLSVGYMLPQRLTAAVSRGRTIRVAIQGTNLGLWTNYSGKDPNVNSSMGEVVRDTGVLPTPRLWQVSVGVN